MGIPDPLACLLRNHVRKQQLELDMEQQTSSKSGKGVHQGCILSPCLFNLYAEYIMRNAGLDEAQVKEDSEKVGLKLNIQKTKIMASGSIAS